MDEQELYAKIRERAKNTPEEWGKLMDKAAAEIDRLRAENERLKALLIGYLPMCYVCPECGPFAKVDVDECCTSCGRDCEIKDSKAVLEGGSRE